MKDLKVKKWEESIGVIRRLLWSRVEPICRIPELNSVAETYKTNLLAVAALATFPTFAFIIGRNYQKCETEACLRLLKKPFPDNPLKPSKQIRELTKAFLSGGHPDRPSVGTSGDLSETYEHLGFGFQDSFVLIASFQLVGMWTLCETLCGDLWEAAVNARPSLSKLDGKLKKAEKDPFDLFKTNQDERQIPIRCLQEMNFRIATKMGTILRQEERVKFTSIWNIRDAYNRTFGNKKDIRDAIKNPSLVALSVIRNAIVHKAGVWDEESVEQANALPQAKQLLPPIHPGRRVRVDGDVLSKIMPTSANSCLKLILAVDAWLVHDSKQSGKNRKR